jgi:hypothetical protein
MIGETNLYCKSADSCDYIQGSVQHMVDGSYSQIAFVVSMAAIFVIWAIMLTSTRLTT